MEEAGEGKMIEGRRRGEEVVGRNVAEEERGGGSVKVTETFSRVGVLPLTYLTA